MQNYGTHVNRIDSRIHQTNTIYNFAQHQRHMALLFDCVSKIKFILETLSFLIFWKFNQDFHCGESWNFENWWIWKRRKVRVEWIWLNLDRLSTMKWPGHVEISHNSGSFPLSRKIQKSRLSVTYENTNNFVLSLTESLVLILDFNDRRYRWSWIDFPYDQEWPHATHPPSAFLLNF